MRVPDVGLLVTEDSSKSLPTPAWFLLRATKPSLCHLLARELSAFCDECVGASGGNQNFDGQGEEGFLTF